MASLPSMEDKYGRYVSYLEEVSDMEERETFRLVMVPGNIFFILSSVYEHIIQSLGFIVLLYI
jgi:hypothetical protein